MKKTLYGLLSGCLFLLAGCHDVTVGYLFTDEAKYPMDRLEIYNIQDRIKSLEAKLAEFNSKADELKEEYDRLNGIFQEKQTELEECKRTVASIEEELDALTPGTDDARIAELQKKLNEELYPLREVLAQAKDEAEAALKEAEKEINTLADKLGMQSPLIVQKEIDELNTRIEYDIPWTTSVIQGVKGTEPLLYEVAGVKGPDEAAAAAFSRYVGMMGGGRIYVKQDVNVPAGEYVISVKVSNEEREKVFTDIFTFVVSE